MNCSVPMKETTQSILSSTLEAPFKKDIQDNEICPEESAQGRLGVGNHAMWGRVEVTGGIGSGKKNT